MVAAQESDLSSEADYAYGQSMEFRLRASELGDFTKATLFFRPHTTADVFSVEIPLEGGSEININYIHDLTQLPLPPFSSVAYWWELEREDGKSIRIPEETISYVDDQFSWQWITTTDSQGGGNVTIHWTGDNPDSGQLVLDAVSDSLQRLGPYLPQEQIRPFNVFVYPSSADLASAMRLAGRSWEPGVTYPDLGVLLVTMVNEGTAAEELRAGIASEFPDLLLYQALGEDYYNLPIWVRAGLVQIAAGDEQSPQEIISGDPQLQGELLSIDELCNSFPTEGERAQLARVQSASLLKFVTRNYGVERIGELILGFSEGETCPHAMSDTLNVSIGEMEQAWQSEEVATGGNNTSTIATGLFWLGLLVAGFLVAGLLIWRPSRQKTSAQ